MVNVDVVVVDAADVDFAGDAVLNGVEAVTVVGDDVCVVPFDVGEPKVIWAVEVDMVVLDVVLVNMDDIDGVTEGFSGVLVLMGVIDEGVEDFGMSFVVVAVVLDVDLCVEGELLVVVVIGDVPMTDSSSSAVDVTEVVLLVVPMPKLSKSVVICRLKNTMIF